jgi:multiple sugar transport system permease protein
MVMALFNVTYRTNEFIGLANFLELMRDHMFWNAIVATLKMCAIIIPGTVALSLWIAFTIHDRSRTLQSGTKIVFYLTSVVSQVALAIAWKFMFNPAYGLSATITEALGIPRLDWLGSSDLAIPLVSALVITFAISQPIILFASALDGIPRAFHEVAQLEGATHRQQFLKVTLPLIRPTLTFVIVTATIGNLQVFVVPYLLTGGGPHYQTTTMLYMIYRNAFEFGRYGYAAAMGIVLFAIIGLLVLIQYRLVNTSEQY